MKFGKTLLAATAATALLLGTAACSSSSAPAESGTAAAADLGTLKVGATAVPAGDIIKFIAEGQAKDAGLTIEYTEFSDYITPNTSLDEGSIDANLFQHQPYLINFNDENGTDLVWVGAAYLPPLALYSNKVDSVEEIASGDTIAVPNDPTNEGRALSLLADAGLIEIADGASTVADVTDAKGLKLQEVEAASLPATLDDSAVTASIVNLSFALPAGLTGDQQILAEGTDSPYYNGLVTTVALQDDPRIAKLHELLTSDATKEFIETTYNGLVVPAEG